MRKILFLLIACTALVATPVLTTSCTSAPSSRVTEVKTLKTVAVSVDAAMKVAAQLYKDGKITAGQWLKIADFHDNTFQPAFKLAVSSVQADLSSVASPDILGLAAQLADLVAKLQPAK